MPTFRYNGAFSRRFFFFTLVILTTLFALALLTSVYQKDGLSPLEIGLLLLYAVLIGWISFSFWAACIGFFIRLSGRDRYAVSQTASHALLPQEARVALVMPIHNEDPKRVSAGLQAICEDLIATGQHAGFDVYVLSDTRDPEIWVEEELRWQQLSHALQGKLKVYYRNRELNHGRKVGNLKDFCTRWGGHYRYLIVLDADSLMSGESLVKMARIMENNPQVALLQVPPAPIGKESLFARILQFASSVYGPIFTTGLNFWQLGEGNYWGHNAIIRTRAFTDHCGLPRLPGREPFGGEIFSHDFVEAAMLRRAGWQVWLAYDMSGSYEELPPTLIDYAKRDRRWCQGNLQHAKLVFARGWHPINRLHFIMGIMSYLASPLWLLFLIMTGADAYIRAQTEPVYFLGDTLFPIWPESYAVEMTTVLVVTLAMLFLPKLLALLLLLSQPAERERYGGAARASWSVLLETLTSALLAPVLMLFQTKFVLAILLRRNISWATQQRGDHQTGLLDALAAHGGHTVVGLLAGWLSYRYIPDFFWWFIPVLLGMLLSIPFSMFLSNLRLGQATLRRRLFLIPEEHRPPAVLERMRAHLRQPDPAPLDQPGNRFLQVILDPPINALHLSMLPAARLTSKRHRHYLQGLVYQLLEEGADKLGVAEKRALLNDPETLRELHLLAWSLPRLSASFGQTTV
jgi:membrane glycosyltransferase